jgi:hypothetical protein
MKVADLIGHVSDNGNFVAVGTAKRYLFFKRSVSLLAILGILLAILMITVVWLVIQSRLNDHRSKSTNIVEQQSLETNLSYALKHNYNQMVVSDTTQLIDGENHSNFQFSPSKLSTFYLDRGAALTNMGKYSQAQNSFQAAAALGGTNKQAALQGEVTAGYAAGERQQLIPLLRQLVVLLEKVHDPLAPTSAQYQNDITAIQHNQPVDL